MKKNKILLFCVAVVMVISFAACNQLNMPGIPDIDDDRNTQEEQTPNGVVSDFTLTGKKPSEIISYLSENFVLLTDGQADTYLIGLEDAQMAMKESLEEKVFADNVQKALQSNDKSSISDLIKEVEDNGFKIQTAEGMYFPVIDYGKYKKWYSNSSVNIKDYINIRAKESDNPSAKDAAIAVSWKEYAERVIAMCDFVESHPGSVRYNQISQDYKMARQILYNGFNNTPLFDYQTRKAKKEVIDELKLAANSSSNTVARELSEFIALVEKNNYELTQEVKEFQEKRKNDKADL